MITFNFGLASQEWFVSLRVTLAAVCINRDIAAVKNDKAETDWKE